jgi:hypothetical protein
VDFDFERSGFDSPTVTRKLSVCRFSCAASLPSLQFLEYNVNTLIYFAGKTTSAVTF